MSQFLKKRAKLIYILMFAISLFVFVSSTVYITAYNYTAVDYDEAVLKDNTIDMDHTYEYTTEGRMGIKKHVEIVGYGKLQYSAVVNLSSAIITSNNNGKDITIQIEAPYIDINSIKLRQNSLVIQDRDYSFFCNRTDSAQAQKLYMDSFVDSGVKKLSELYSQKDKQNHLDRVAISEVHSLVRALNLNGDVNIRVEIIK